MHILICDGGCRGNNQIGKPKHGYGSYIILKGSSLDSATQIDQDTFSAPSNFGVTNNRMKYTALIRGLEALLKKSPDKKILIMMDSRLVLNQVAGFYKTRKPHLVPLRDKARELLSEFKETVLIWAPRDLIESYVGH